MKEPRDEMECNLRDFCPHLHGCTRSWDRFAIVCVFHPVMQELFLTAQRQIGSESYFKKYQNDPNREYHALRSIAVASVTEEALVLYRRMMLGAMLDPTAAVLAIIVTGLEEACVRSTMVYRDELWDWLTNRQPTQPELKARRLVQAASTANSMRIEVTSIVTSR